MTPAVYATQTTEVLPADRAKVNFRIADLAEEYWVSASRLDAIEVVGGHAFNDPGTGLQWTIELSQKDLSWHQAEEYCGGLTLGGFDDWRLPSDDELIAVVFPDSGGPFSVLPHFNLGPECDGARVWSSTGAADIITPGDRPRQDGVAMVRDRDPAPFHQRAHGLPGVTILPGVRAVVLDLASGKLLGSARNEIDLHRAFCVRELEPAASAGKG
jgi:hypothetical protein